MAFLQKSLNTIAENVKMTNGEWISGAKFETPAAEVLRQAKKEELSDHVEKMRDFLEEEIDIMEITRRMCGG